MVGIINQRTYRYKFYFLKVGWGCLIFLSKDFFPSYHQVVYFEVMYLWSGYLFGRPVIPSDFLYWNIIFNLCDMGNNTWCFKKGRNVVLGTMPATIFGKITRAHKSGLLKHFFVCSLKKRNFEKICCVSLHKYPSKRH